MPCAIRLPSSASISARRSVAPPASSARSRPAARSISATGGASARIARTHHVCRDSRTASVKAQ